MENTNNDRKSDPWKFIRDTVESVESYYGINFRQGLGSRIESDMVNELLEFGYMQLPNSIYAKCIDGKIRKGKLSQRVAIDMIAFRPLIKSKTMSKSQWETLLTKSNSVYTYCFENKTFHPEIIPAVGLYLMEHELSKAIYKVILNEVHLSETLGETARTFDMYIKREKSISVKKDIFAQQLDENDTQINTKSEYFAWQYVKNQIMSNEPETVVELSADDKVKLLEQAAQNDIIGVDLIHRVETGKSVSNAIMIGKDESEKYGFKYIDKDIRVYGPSGSYNMHGVNYNMMMYIKYLASAEGLEVPGFEE